MTTAKKLLTADDLLAMPDDGMRRELIRGELIEMPPASDDHGFAGHGLTWRMGAFIPPAWAWPGSHCRNRVLDRGWTGYRPGTRLCLYLL